MKFIYTIILFLVFFNIFTFLFAGLNIIPYEYTVAGDVYTEDMSGEELFTNLSGIDFDDITSLSMKNADLLLIAGGGIVLAILFRSAAPFAVGLFLGIFVNTFRRSTSIFYSFGIDSYLMVAAIVGIIFLLIITLIEYFTQGDT